MNKLLKLLHIEFPIIQAPVGGIATPELAAAVSNSGGLGGIALSWSDDNDAETKINKVQSLTSKPFYVNFVLNFEPKALKKALEMGVKVIQFSWGMPNKEQVDLVKSFNATIGIQVTDKHSALKAISLGAEYLVCQGVEAGGHVQASKSLETALKEVVEVANQLPVVASGGISTGKNIHHYVQLGASGVVMGSRFVVSLESGAHPFYKETLVKANSDDTVLTACMNKGWENSTSRIIRNSTFSMWEADGCALIGNRPGEFDQLGTSPTGKSIERYSISVPTIGFTGEVEAMAMYVGTSVQHINEVKSASDIIKDIWAEYLSCS